MGKFRAALDSSKFKQQIVRDEGIAQQFQAGGTPHFFVNGRRIGIRGDGDR